MRVEEGGAGQCRAAAAHTGTAACNTAGAQCRLVLIRSLAHRCDGPAPASARQRTAPQSILPRKRCSPGRRRAAAPRPRPAGGTGDIKIGYLYVYNNNQGNTHDEGRHQPSTALFLSLHPRQPCLGVHPEVLPLLWVPRPASIVVRLCGEGRWQETGGTRAYGELSDGREGSAGSMHRETRQRAHMLPCRPSGQPAGAAPSSPTPCSTRSTSAAAARVVAASSPPTSPPQRDSCSRA